MLTQKQKRWSLDIFNNFAHFCPCSSSFQLFGCWLIPLKVMRLSPLI